MNETEKQHSRTWQSVCDEFFSTQQASFQESPCPLPSMRLPLWQRALFYRPAADAAAFDVAEMDISEDVKFHFAENGRGDVRIVARVFRIPIGKKGCFRVVSAFLSPESERLADGGDVAALREYVERKYELFRREEGLPRLRHHEPDVLARGAADRHLPADEHPAPQRFGRGPDAHQRGF